MKNFEPHPFEKLFLSIQVGIDEKNVDSSWFRLFSKLLNLPTEWTDKLCEDWLTKKQKLTSLSFVLFADEIIVRWSHLFKVQYHKLSESLPKSLKMNKLQLPDTASATSTLTLDGDNEEERNSAMGYQQTLMVSK